MAKPKFLRYFWLLFRSIENWLTRTKFAERWDYFSRKFEPSFNILNQFTVDFFFARKNFAVWSHVFSMTRIFPRRLVWQSTTCQTKLIQKASRRVNGYFLSSVGIINEIPWNSGSLIQEDFSSRSFRSGNASFRKYDAVFDFAEPTRGSACRHPA